jgi:CheY-like chemotaxis protein
LGRLAGGIAHDFNNLLVAIVNYSAFVAEETIDNPAVRADVEQIQVAAERAARLTNQLLSFAERTAAAPEALDLNAIVVDVHDLLDSSLGANIELVVESRETLPSIRADRSHIEQVLVNLAVNARDAMPAGGTLTIETSAVELDEGYAHLRPVVGGGHFVELAVSDTGTGMSTEVAAHIFEPFFTTKPTGEGTGLSLATVYGTIVESGGTMSVYSERGVGTTFKFYFPATDAPVEATPIPIAPRGNGETILIVEDEPSVLELTARILRRNGYIALQSATFEAAVSMAAAHDFQLLLTDSVMPESSGRALAARVDELRPGRPVLYMSGHSQGVHRALGDALFIQKPFNSRTLLEQVHTALTRPTIPGDHRKRPA